MRNIECGMVGYADEKFINEEFIQHPTFNTQHSTSHHLTISPSQHLTNQPEVHVKLRLRAFISPNSKSTQPKILCILAKYKYPLCTF